MHEKVLVVPGRFLFSGQTEGFQGFRSGLNAGLSKRIAAGSFFISRIRAEKDPQFKQVIIYLVLRYRTSVFIYRRVNASTEKRLLHKYSLGLGGHINPSPVLGWRELIHQNLHRELNEEVFLQDHYSYHFLGTVNDDQTEVGKYHLGLVYLVSCASPGIVVRETNKLTGRLLPASQILKKDYQWETWSSFLIPEIQSLVC